MTESLLALRSSNDKNKAHMGRRRKRNEGLMDVLALLPWWISIVLAVIGFIGMRWVVPMFFTESPVLNGVATGIQSIAWLPFLFLVPVSFVVFVRQKIGEKSAATNHHSSKSKAGDIKITDKAYVPPPGAGRSVEPRLEPSLEQAKEQFSSWSLPAMRALEWKRFELLCAKYYEAVGFKSETIRCGADGGIDVKLFKIDPAKPIAVVQCKAWNTQSVGVKEIRELLGVMAHEKVGRGIFITTGSYTQDALSFGTTNPIQLLDGTAFVKKLQELPMEQQVKLLQFAFEGDYSTPTCASCGIKMVKRNSKRGAFWGCMNYPRCKSTFALKA